MTLAEKEAALSVRIRVVRSADFALDAAFEVPPGITVLFGASGAGKSTIVGAIAGIVRPTTGKIALGTEVWFDAEAKIDVPIHERRVALVQQSLALFPHMTAAQNVAYGIDRSLSRKDRASRAAEGLARFHVAHLADRKPPTFSGGEAQRVALARAFAMAPSIVLLDEPFSAQDRGLRLGLLRALRAFSDDLRVPVIHITHHQNEARAVGDRAIAIADGKIVFQGAVGEAITRAARPAVSADEDFSFAETPIHGGS